MAQQMDSLQVKFSVLGGASVDGESGREILAELQSICSSISSRNLLKVSIGLDTASTKNAEKQAISAAEVISKAYDKYLKLNNKQNAPIFKNRLDSITDVLNSDISLLKQFNEAIDKSNGKTLKGIVDILREVGSESVNSANAILKINELIDAQKRVKIEPAIHFDESVFRRVEAIKRATATLDDGTGAAQTGGPALYEWFVANGTEAEKVILRVNQGYAEFQNTLRGLDALISGVSYSSTLDLDVATFDVSQINKYLATEQKCRIETEKLEAATVELRNALSPGTGNTNNVLDATLEDLERVVAVAPSAQKYIDQIRRNLTGVGPQNGISDDKTVNIVSPDITNGIKLRFDIDEEHLQGIAQGIQLRFNVNEDHLQRISENIQLRFNINEEHIRQQLDRFYQEYNPPTENGNGGNRGNNNRNNNQNNTPRASELLRSARSELQEYYRLRSQYESFAEANTTTQQLEREIQLRQQAIDAIRQSIGAIQNQAERQRALNELTNMENSFVENRNTAIISKATAEYRKMLSLEREMAKKPTDPENLQELQSEYNLHQQIFEELQQRLTAVGDIIQQQVALNRLIREQEKLDAEFTTKVSADQHKYDPKMYLTGDDLARNAKQSLDWVNRLRRDVGNLGDVIGVDELNIQLNILERQAEYFAKTMKNATVISDEDILNAQTLLSELSQISNRVKAISKENVDANALGFSKLARTITEYADKVGNAVRRRDPERYARMIEMLNSAMSGHYNGGYRQLVQDFAQLQAEIKMTGADVETLDQKIKRIFSDKFGYGVIGALASETRRLLRQMLNSVIEIDTAMTELRKVTEETEGTYDRFLTKAADRAKELGATISDVVTASADFARLGYNIDDAATLADVAIVYKNVGDGITDISAASESIISTMQAFGINAEDAMSIVDRFNEVGRYCPAA